MTKEPIMIDGFKLSSIKEMLFEGKRDAISTKTFEEIIYVLEAKEQECDQLKAENKKMSKGYEELTEIVSPYIDDFTGYNEELKGFDIVLCVKELMQQLDQLKAEGEELKTEFDKFEEQIKLQGNFIDGFLFATKNSEWLNKSILEDEAAAIIEKVESDYVQLENYKQALQEIKEICKIAPKETTCDRCHTFGFPPEHELIKLILQKCEEVEEWNKH